MKDHEIAAIINKLRDIAFVYGRHQSLRQRISDVVRIRLQQLKSADEREKRIVEMVVKHMHPDDYARCTFSDEYVSAFIETLKDRAIDEKADRELEE